MPLRAKIILSLIIGIVGITLIFVVVAGVGSFLKKPASTTDTTQQAEQTTPTDQTATDQGNGLPSLTGQTTTGTTPNTTPVPAANPTKKVSKTEDALLTIALPFIERFGTYSNQTNFDNYTVLLPFMTSSMKAWAQGKVDAAASKPFNSLYTGTTTRVLSYTITSLNDGTYDGTAEIKVTTQRKESIGGPTNTRVYNQDAIVKLVKNGDIWLVDNVAWQ